MKAPCAPERVPARHGRLRRLARGVATAMAWTMLAVLVGLGWLFWGQWPSAFPIERTLDAVRPWFLLWRVALFGVLMGFWPFWVRLIARWRHLSDAQHARLAGARWTIAVWLVVLELVLGQNMVGRFLNLLVGLPS